MLDPLGSKLRKSEFPRIRETLDRLADIKAPKREIVKAYVGTADNNGMPVGDLLARTGWRPSVLENAVSSGIQSGSIVLLGQILVRQKHFAALKDRLIGQLETHHKKDPLSKGMSRESLRGPRMRQEIFEGLIASLKGENKIDIAGDTVAIAAKKASLSPDDELIRTRLIKRLSGAGLQVPKTDELISEAITGTKASPAHAKKILFLLFDSGEAVKISEEFIFAGAVIKALIEKLRELAGGGDRTIDVPKFKDIAGVSRKYAIPLLEYFDREKVTLRTGDKRVIR